MSRAALVLLFCASLIAPAQAHRLKLFATVESGAISGFAFFVGSGRAHGADLVFTGQDGQTHRMQTDETGAFQWTPPAPQSFDIVASTGDGHVSEARVEASRFGGAAPDETAQTEAEAPAAATGATQAQIERAVDAAVARQIRPLLEAYEVAETRLRFNDIVGGIGMIVGLAGVALWASARRKGAG